MSEHHRIPSCSRIESTSAWVPTCPPGAPRPSSHLWLMTKASEKMLVALITPSRQSSVVQAPPVPLMCNAVSSVAAR